MNIQDIFLKTTLYDKLPNDKIKINWNKNPIEMKLFLSFLKVPVERSNDHLGSDTGWTQLNNKEIKLRISGGCVNGTEWLESIQYGNNLHNKYNNWVNPFYLFDIMTDEGKKFFSNYYSHEIDKVLGEYEVGISYLEDKIKLQKENLILLKSEIEDIKSIK